jgi:glutamate--cysteine ligase
VVPHLKTALAGPLLDLERRFLDRMPEIEHWLRTQRQEREIPFYASVDLRNAGFKLAPVDTNLFPGGFNNLNPESLPLCVQAIQPQRPVGGRPASAARNRSADHAPAVGGVA